MPKAWTGEHTFLLIVSVLAIVQFFRLRRSETNTGSPYEVGMRRFRYAMLIAGLFGLAGLLRLWLMSR